MASPPDLAMWNHGTANTLCDTCLLNSHDPVRGSQEFPWGLCATIDRADN